MRQLIEGGRETEPRRYTPAMDFSNLWWALAGTAFGVIAQLLIERIRHTHEDYELWCDVVLHGRMPENSHDGSSDFQFVDVLLWSAGKRDIQAGDFDRGRALVICLNVEIARVLPERHAAKYDAGAVRVQEDGRIEIPPALLRAGMALHLRLVTSAFPLLSFDNPIANAETIRSAFDLPPNRLPARTRNIVSWTVTAIGASLSALSLGLLLRNGDAYPWLPLPHDVQLAGAVAIGAALSLLLLGMFYRYSRGPDRALTVLNSALGEDLVPLGISRRRWWAGLAAHGARERAPQV